MALSNHERVGKALQSLNDGLRPYVFRELRTRYGDGFVEEVRGRLQDERRAMGGDNDNWDTQVLLAVMWDRWNEVFRDILGHAERSLVSELREVRNKWAHQNAFSTDDAYRALDSIGRLLTAISAAEQAAEVERQKQEILRIRFEEQARQQTRRSSVTSLEGRPAAGLSPWRDIITPHPDVASGRYQQAEFAADLAQVYRGDATSEYADPREFYGRTFLTEGLKQLLSGALKRLSGMGGDPVVQLQTNFGGGKTHSMLALYHLFSGVPVGELAGIDAVLEIAGVTTAPTARRAVLVGTALDPAHPRTKPDGTVTRTYWGELAHQLLGKEGYALVAEADRQAVSPGSDTLRDLFNRATPCLILIDEWVAFVRNLYGIHGLAAGSFEANLTFAQSLTEAAKAAPRTLVVASIPASNIEIGGHAGQEALDRLGNTFGRVESPWRPASAEEGFEIVRRRLFHPMTDPNSFAARDVVVRAFADLYRANAGEFPSQCREGDYERRLQAAYPIHPELFDRLYTDWSSLDKFQRTRGVLRLMAAVIHSLWQRNDTSLLILPASVPMDEGAVQSELTRYLEEQWEPVISTDIDGPKSLPLALDAENPSFGRFSACRRVARTLFIGSAPTLNTAHKGIEDQQIKLGCAQPGEQPATFGDALRRLTDRATHLYVDGPRYWYATQPTVTRLALDRAAQQRPDDIQEEIRTRLRASVANRGSLGDFERVHVCPPTTADVPDEHDARLVILDPTAPHIAKTDSSPARVAAERFLNDRGTGPRRFRNTLVFLAADKARLEELESAARQYLAWKSIEAETDTLNLDPFQAKQAKTKREQADQTVKLRIPETYSWLIVPGQGSDPQSAVTWDEIRLQGEGELGVRASRKLRNEDLLTVQYAGTLLRMKLDEIPLWRGDHVTVKQLCEDFAQYLYLPRLRNDIVLSDAVRDGVNRLSWEQETFAYADGWSDGEQTYLGLRAQEMVTVAPTGLVVKPSVARAAMELDEERRKPGSAGGTTVSPDGKGGGNVVMGPSLPPAPPVVHTAPRRFYATVTVDALRLSRDVSTYTQEVIQHITSLHGADVKVTLEIEARIPEGAPDNVVRTVTENCRTLGFQSAEFEAE